MGVDVTKVTQLRNNEYYCMQETFDFLYKKSKEGYIFNDLIPFIISDNNLQRATFEYAVFSYAQRVLV